jgi:SAM-dependent methyltransferase
LSSGFRIYHHTLLRQVECFGAEFNLLPEITVKAWMGGWKVAEIPFTCLRRGDGRSKVRWIRQGFSFLETFLKLSGTRYSVAAADYDERAFYSAIPMQRFWQRSRVKEILSFAPRTGRILDAGCGSSVILRGLGKAVGMDLRHPKTRYMRRYGLPMVTASIVGIPFVEASFDSVICSQVIEHVPADPRVFTELDRVLKPGGRLILGTPDYSRWTWRLIERLYGWLLPGGYDMPSEHITHYHRAGLVRLLQTMGYRQIQYRYVFRSELILTAIKPDLPAVVKAGVPVVS